MKGVGRRRLEPILLVPLAGVFVLCVDKDCSESDVFRSGDRLRHRISEQAGPNSLALVIGIYRKPGEQDDRNGPVLWLSLSESGSRGNWFHICASQRVVAKYMRSVLCRDKHASRARSMA